jgi:NAD(P)H-hydrate epimerase
MAKTKINEMFKLGWEESLSDNCRFELISKSLFNKTLKQVKSDSVVAGKPLRYATVEQVREIDRMAIEEFGIPSIVLMENAGRSVAEHVQKLLEDVTISRRQELFNQITMASPCNNKPEIIGHLFSVCVVCGSGNNAGDGLVSTRYLHNYGIDVNVLLLKERTGYKGDLLTNLLIVEKLKIPIIEINSSSELKPYLDKSELIIDAILGTGIKGKVTGLYKDVIQMINDSNKPIVSIDIPSGLDGNTGLPVDICAKADVTVTMGLPKIGFAKAKEYVGDVIVADIGYPSALLYKLNEGSETPSPSNE